MEAAQLSTNNNSVNVYNVPTQVVEGNVPIQLHRAYDGSKFLLTANEMDGANKRNWAMVSIQFPQVLDDQTIAVRICVTMIKGDLHQVRLPGAGADGVSDGVINSYMANVPDAALRGSGVSNLIRIRTNYTPLADIFATGAFSVADQKRIVGWCNTVLSREATAEMQGEEMSGKGKSLPIVPANDGAALAFTIKLNINPNTGEHSKSTPIGVNQFALRGFTLLNAGGITAFEGFESPATGVEVIATSANVKVNTAQKIAAAASPGILDL